MSTPPHRKDYGYSRTVSYDSHHTFAVIIQCYGSIWKQVLPYCIFNTALTWLLLYLLSRDIDWTVSEWGHEFMSVLVSFLMVNKFNLTLSVYYEMQSNLNKMGRATRQIVMLACSLPRHNNNNDSGDVDGPAPTNKAAVAWRAQVSYYALLLLSTTSTMLTKANNLNAWEAAGMSDDERASLPLVFEATAASTRQLHQNSKIRHSSRDYQPGYHLPSDLNLRVPVMVAQKLYQAIAASGTPALLDTMQTKQLMDQVELFLEAYHGIRVYLNVPLPFAFVQMERIFLFAYVFTIPFAILSADLKLLDSQVVPLVFIMTYGFIGTEIVCTNMDDPFGKDPSDLPVVVQAQELFEDVYLMVSQTDGVDAALRLRNRMKLEAPQRTPSEEDALLAR